MQPGFCVAKYEMSYSDAIIPDSTGWWTDWNTMHYNSVKSPVSQAGLYPIADITQQQSIDSCKIIWGHLITNNEWMTISRNIEQQWQNWSTWITWSGYLYNWVSNFTMWCNWITNTIYTLPRTRATKTGEWSSWSGASDCDSKRQLKLSNWEVIWDLAGNVREHVNKANTIDWSLYNNWQTSVAWSSSWINWDDDGKYDVTDMLKYGSILWFWTANGLWNLYYANWVASNIFLRGAGSQPASNAGVFALFLARSSDTAGRNAGFRCAR
jgi:hypothetical protein